MSETYIPNARDAVIAYFGTTSWGAYRVRCVVCCDADPLANPAKVYGDLFVPSGPENRAEDAETCEACGVSLLSLSQSCQREHDEQQARFARGPITHVVEMGMTGAIRCRVY